MGDSMKYSIEERSYAVGDFTPTLTLPLMGRE